MSKILKITMILVMTFFAVFITPQERASANPLAVGGALYLGGAGVYVLGAVAVGGIAGLAGCVSCQEDIEAHASRTWDGTTQLAKDGLQLMIDSSVGAWGATSSALTATDSQFNTWMDKQISGFAETYINSKYYGSVGMSPTGIPSESKLFSGRQIFTAGIHDANKRFIINGQHVTHYEFSGYSNSLTMKIYTGSAFVNLTPVLPASMTYAQFQNRMAATSNNLSAMASVMALAGINVMVGNLDIYQSYQAAVSSFSEPWTEMKDAGLVLPTDNARPMAGNIPLTYDPVSDSYAGIDGVRVPHEDVTGFEYQKPHWKTLEDLAMLGLSGLGAGLYIDGWAGSDSITSTYDPATDITTDSITTSTPHTNVTTGETVTSTTTSTTTTTGDTTSNNNPTPDGQTPKTQSGKANRWGKLVTTKFPFSLPWDLFFILSFMNADPVSPVFEVDERILKRENVEGIQIKFSIDLSFLDPYVPWFRRLLVIGFAFFLVMNTRKLLGGAQ